MHALFRNREFTRLFAGRPVTNAGDSLYFVAAMWLVRELTGNEFYSGLAGFLTLAPSWLQFLSRPLVDRWSLRRVLVGTQLLQGLLVLVVPAAALTGHLSVWLVLVVMPALSLCNQLAYPAETAALPRLVDREELVGANSLFSVAYQGVDAVFNALAGLLIALLGAVAVVRARRRHRRGAPAHRRAVRPRLPPGRRDERAPRLGGAGGGPGGAAGSGEGGRRERLRRRSRTRRHRRRCRGPVPGALHRRGSRAPSAPAGREMESLAVARPGTDD